MQIFSGILFEDHTQVSYRTVGDKYPINYAQVLKYNETQFWPANYADKRIDLGRVWQFSVISYQLS
ncbi:MAG: hypothetical protein DRR08_31515 [Candidatus Parabeggiatoa sp. nov. 2]|nr:MAG: hypothetical protein DRR08_31515 [Gammaproteobacteria bacterium]